MTSVDVTGSSETQISSDSPQQQQVPSVGPQTPLPSPSLSALPSDCVFHILIFSSLHPLVLLPLRLVCRTFDEEIAKRARLWYQILPKRLVRRIQRSRRRGRGRGRRANGRRRRHQNGMGVSRSSRFETEKMDLASTMKYSSMFYWFWGEVVDVSVRKWLGEDGLSVWECLARLADAARLRKGTFVGEKKMMVVEEGGDEERDLRELNRRVFDEGSLREEIKLAQENRYLRVMDDVDANGVSSLEFVRNFYAKQQQEEAGGPKPPSPQVQEQIGEEEDLPEEDSPTKVPRKPYAILCEGCNKSFLPEDVPDEDRVLMTNACWSFRDNLQAQRINAHRGFCSRRCFRQRLVKCPFNGEDSPGANHFVDVVRACLVDYYNWGDQVRDFLGQFEVKKLCDGLSQRVSFSPSERGPWQSSDVKNCVDFYVSGGACMFVGFFNEDSSPLRSLLELPESCYRLGSVVLNSSDHWVYDLDHRWIFFLY